MKFQFFFHLSFQDFSDAFIGRIKTISYGFAQTRLVFDRYVETSLKSRTRNDRSIGYIIRYQICDATNIENVTIKEFLSHIKTKQDLTIYLAQKFMKEFTKLGARYSVTYDLQSQSNIDNYSPELLEHDHEEADTLLIVEAIDVARNDPFTECYIYSPDTDVLVLLIHHYQMLPQVRTKSAGLLLFFVYYFFLHRKVFAVVFLK